MENKTARRAGAVLGFAPTKKAAGAKTPARRCNAVIAAVLICVSVFGATGQTRLLVIGGGERPEAAMKKFTEWGGGSASRVLVITWASGVPEESFESLKKAFLDLGSSSVIHAPMRPLDAEKRDRFIEQLKTASAVFFSGGDQNRIMDVLADEELLSLLKARFRAGVPFGGTSAGAAVMSDPMITGDADLKILDGTKVGVRSGLGLIPNVIFDQHFLVRQRHNRLLGLVIENPRFLGIGIDEDTAVLIEAGRRMTVVGKTKVLVVGARKGQSELVLNVLGNGKVYDLRARKTLQ